ncbi:hypothetical protein BJ165DRAFT_688229 [Panaeolus papilionaceus]|nr:hypothetical protein BJ165DRAFT_688229 [Panaeolus papilionaceus]
MIQLDSGCGWALSRNESIFENVTLRISQVPKIQVGLIWNDEIQNYCTSCTYVSTQYQSI